MKARHASAVGNRSAGHDQAHVVPGVTTGRWISYCHDHIVNVQGARPAIRGLPGLPKTVLTSVNHVVCHGIPSPSRR